MASRAEIWRERIAERLARLPGDADPAGHLLANVIGQPSPELEALVAGPAREAAVLVGLIDRGHGPRILLTERATHLAHHPGQVSFPGGRLSQAESHEAAALREAMEEVALNPAQVQVLGQLPPRLTGTGFAVTPVVGWLDAAFEAEPDPSEVQSAFEVPVEHLLDPGSRAVILRERYGSRFRGYEFAYGAHRIWGATAGILAEFFEVIDAKTI